MNSIAAIRVPVSSLRESEDNPRIISDKKFKALVKSVRNFPEMLDLRPIVADNDGTILGGNMRYRACVAAGFTEVPAVFVGLLTDAQKKEFVIKDNVSGGEWDFERLAAEWNVGELSDWGVDVPGAFLDDLAGVEEDGYEVDLDVATDISVGDEFMIGPHRLICGDSTKVPVWDRLFNGEKCDAVVTDPPYNVNYTGGTDQKLQIQNDNMDDALFRSFLTDAFLGAVSVCRPGSAWYVWHADSEGRNFRLAFTDAGLLLKQCLVWVKNTFVMGRQDYQWGHEPCLYGWVPGAAHYFTKDRTQSTVYEDAVDFKKLKKEELLAILERIVGGEAPQTIIRCDKPTKNGAHPTMKPVRLLATLIKNSTKPGQIVGDGFLGSGSTMVAAHQLGRKCYGLELDPRYCRAVIERMAELDPDIEIRKV